VAGMPKQTFMGTDSPSIRRSFHAPNTQGEPDITGIAEKGCGPQRKDSLREGSNIGDQLSVCMRVEIAGRKKQAGHIQHLTRGQLSWRASPT